jgi:hypothetical protein
MNIPTDTVTLPLTPYHYTTFAGACGIASTLSLRASSIRHLSDATEFTYAHDILRQVLEKNTRGMAAGVSAAVEFMVRHLDLSNVSRTLNLMGRFGVTYVVSLSSEPDKLSQWRAYSSGGGYALGFRVPALQAIAQHQRFKLIKCSYDRDEHLTAAEVIAAKVIESIQKLPPQVLSAIEPKGSYSPHATQCRWRPRPA